MSTPDNRPADRLSGEVVMALVVLVLTSFVMMINETSLSVALPHIMAEFDVTAAIAQWLLTGVMLTMAIMMPTTGWILDRFTTRAVYLFAVIVFFLGTVLAAVSPAFWVMLLGRVFQAMGTAVMMPLLLTVVMTVVPSRRRGSIMGVISVVMAVGPALGPSFAGLMMTIGSWHLIFWVLVPGIAAAGVIGAWKLGNVGELKATPLDLISVLLSALAFGGLIYGLSSIGIVLDGGRGALIVVAAALVGVLSLVLFIWRQIAMGKKGRALLDLGPFGVRNFSFGLAAMVTIQFALFGVVNLLPMYLQGALLATALAAGMVNLPGGLVETVLSPIAGALYDRVGPRPLIITGTIIMSASLFWLSTIDENTAIGTVVWMFAVLSVALAMVLTPLMTNSLGSLSADLYSHGSAIMNTLLQLAGAAGTAVLIAVFSYINVAGGGNRAAMADGTARAFLVAAVVSLVAVALSFFITRPAGTREVVVDSLD
ncbi:DHA2 family efflux MFS transporter permease subunit [Corynebacterium guangdongense]|uniref:DHA2 family lincomycin resistance protein-like MFS transporter n=1 Tax=Corynebacterium guangdongense TaxID=1783348 RepID=A0ABU1ZZM5_9CORY|nr:DHA2 family efflux MFS transporter permease subunit [Corynebacterium guangdongense]MDR7330375.1 DHA2 family lincomycin resistance protein-like MFS transporter [Corynebacterium guangdongense]WJZ18933.1 Multidrug export protein EmrB [Corynebacterium guangdongense]